MFTDARKVGSERLEADICIIGGGAAGITIANKFAGARQRVVLLESGGDTLEKETERLNRNATVTGEPYPLDTTRLRFFGGATNHWSGHCYRFTEADLLKVGADGVRWPIRLADVEPYYAEAARLSLHRDPISWSMEDWRKRTSSKGWPIDPTLFVGRVFQQGDLDPATGTRTFTVYRGPLEKASNVTVVQHANVTELLTDGDGSRVEAARVRTLAQTEFLVQAKTFILAAGGVENPRILLASRGSNPNGLGNSHDLVGRYFTDHVVLFQDMVMNPAQQPDALMDVEKLPAGSTASFHYMLTPRARERAGIDMADDVFIRVDRFYPPVDAGVAALQRVRGALRRKAINEVDPDDLKIAIGDIGNTTAHAANRYYCGAPGRFQIAARIAPSGVAASRITLRSERDAVGMPMINLHWALPESGKHNAQRAINLFASEVGRTNAGRVKTTLDPNAPWPKPPELEVGYHHTCTTRMSDDPRLGVVDRNCRVHGTSNLYVAGSSVFSECGGGSTTMMLLALALRLVDHLQKETL